MTSAERRTTWLMPALGAVAVLFGLMTLRAGSNVLFGDGSSHAGPVVPFVLWFNFLAGFAYVAAGVGFLLRKRWSAPVAVVLGVSTLLVFVAFGVHVAHGGAFAPTTIGALTLRTGFWAFVAWRAHLAFCTKPALAQP